MKRLMTLKTRSARLVSCSEHEKIVLDQKINYLIRFLCIISEDEVETNEEDIDDLGKCQ